MADSELFDDEMRMLAREGRVVRNAPDAVVTDLRARLNASLGLPPVAAAIATPSALAMTRPLLSIIVAASLGVGALGGFALAHRFAERAPTPVVAPAPAPAPQVIERVVERIVWRDREVVSAPVSLRQVVGRVVVAPARTFERAVDAPSPIQTHVDDDAMRSAERLLLSRAQNALARGNFEQTLEALESHQTQFSRGWLAEERDALRVQALSGAQRSEEARAAAATFVSTYPRSLFRSLVEQAVGAN